MNTLLFDPDQWGELLVDINGDIAVTGEPYRTAQDVATSVRLFKNDVWYDTSDGIPYLGTVYALKPDIPVLKSNIERQALNVSKVKTANAVITGFKNRTFSSRVIINNNLEVNV